MFRASLPLRVAQSRVLIPITLALISALLAGCDGAATTAPPSTGSSAAAPASSNDSTGKSSGTPGTTPSPSGTTGGAGGTGPSGSIVNPLAGAQFYVASPTSADSQAAAWRASNPGNAELMDALGAQPTAIWLGNWNTNVQSDVAAVESAAAAQGTMPVLVVYNIPNRDCGSYSAGGSSGAAAYAQWIASVAAGLSSPAVIILEPDALAQMSCLSTTDQAARLAMLHSAVDVLKAAHAFVYLDGGNAAWIPAASLAPLLQSAGLADADGFSLNVSNYISTAANVSYGMAVSAATNGKHFLIDTSRNGIGTANGQWCNPSGQGVGTTPTSNTGIPLVDALLWIKIPGESDGTCNGGPAAGAWWPDMALQLVQNASPTLTVVSGGSR